VKQLQCSEMEGKRAASYMLRMRWKLSWLWQTVQRRLGGVFNIGSTEEVRIVDLATKIMHLVHSNDQNKAGTGDSETIQYIPYDNAYAVGFEDMRKRVPDNSKIYAYTGWSPRHTLDQTLRDVLSAAQQDQSD
jgi:nucleoside-diphosphate-sugar epimerase